MKKIFSFLRAPMSSPLGLVIWAVMFALVFGAVHALGLRDYTTFISGTAPSGEPLTSGIALLGVLYLLLYFAFILVTPIMLIAAGILWALQKLTSRPAVSK